MSQTRRQRGVTYVRYGDSVASAVVDKGEADMIISFEKLESARWLPYLKKDGVLITNLQEIDPMPVSPGKAANPSGVLETLAGHGCENGRRGRIAACGGSRQRPRGEPDFAGRGLSASSICLRTSGAEQPSAPHGPAENDQRSISPRLPKDAPAPRIGEGERGLQRCCRRASSPSLWKTRPGRMAEISRILRRRRRRRPRTSVAEHEPASASCGRSWTTPKANAFCLAGLKPPRSPNAIAHPDGRPAPGRVPMPWRTVAKDPGENRCSRGDCTPS